jgi:hypothetical protein
MLILSASVTDPNLFIKFLFICFVVALAEIFVDAAPGLILTVGVYILDGGEGLPNA